MGLTPLAGAIGELGLQGHAVGRIVFVGDEAANMHDAQAAAIEYVIVAAGTRTQEQLLADGVPAERIVPTFDRLPEALGIV